MTCMEVGNKINMNALHVLWFITQKNWFQLENVYLLADSVVTEQTILSRG